MDELLFIVNFGVELVVLFNELIGFEWESGLDIGWVLSLELLV